MKKTAPLYGMIRGVWLPWRIVRFECVTTKVNVGGGRKVSDIARLSDQHKTQNRFGHV